MKKKVLWVVVIIVLVLAVAGYFVYDGFYSRNNPETVARSFKINTILLKSSLSQGDFVSSNLKLTNFEDEQNFKLRFDGLGGIVTVDEYEFALEAWEEKLIEVKFKGFHTDVEGIYSGFLVVETDIELKHIPVIVDVQSRKPVFAVNLFVTPDYKELIPGEDLFTEIRIFNLNDSKRHQIKVTSLIKNFNGELIFSDTEQRVVAPGTHGSSVSKTVALPEDLPFGSYVFGVLVEFEGKVSSSSFLFDVVAQKEGSGFLNKFEGTDSLTYIFAGAIFLILILIIILVFYLMQERDKLFLELRRQHNNEIQVLMSELNRRRGRRLAQVKEPEEKEFVEKEYKEIKKVAVKKVKEKQSEQKKIFKKLKKEKKSGLIKRKLAQWKSQGINVSELDMIARKVEKSLGERMRDYKKQGYKV